MSDVRHSGGGVPRGWRYRGWDVMAQEHEWDERTRAVVRDRLASSAPSAIGDLSKGEADVLRRLCGAIVGDGRPAVLDWILSHIASKCGAPLAESDRREGVPAFGELLARGVRALDSISRRQHGGRGFAELVAQDCGQVVAALASGSLPPDSSWQGAPADEFWRRLRGAAVEAYASHPTVWSEMGYAGPAYPRGYVRIQRGGIDSWEAREDARE